MAFTKSRADKASHGDDVLDGAGFWRCGPRRRFCLTSGFKTGVEAALANAAAARVTNSVDAAKRSAARPPC